MEAELKISVNSKMTCPKVVAPTPKNEMSESPGGFGTRQMPQAVPPPPSPPHPPPPRVPGSAAWVWGLMT